MSFDCARLFLASSSLCPRFLLQDTNDEEGTCNSPMIWVMMTKKLRGRETTKKFRTKMTVMKRTSGNDEKEKEKRNLKTGLVTKCDFVSLE